TSTSSICASVSAIPRRGVGARSWTRSVRRPRCRDDPPRPCCSRITSTMHRPAGDAAVTVVIRSRAGDSPRLRESLYAVAALVRAEVRAVVIVDSTDPPHHREVLTAVERVRGLLNLAIRVAGGRPQTAARALTVGPDAVV